MLRARVPMLSERLMPLRRGLRLALAALLLAGLAPAAGAQGTDIDLSLSATLAGGAQNAARAGAVDPVLANYRLDTGDQVSVTVYGEPDLAVEEARVRGDGTIPFPLIGDVQVRGLTSQELAARITRRLADGYLKNPDVSVSIDRYRLYYIKGEVNRPGGYSYVEGLTVQKAIALAGGYTPRASEDKVTLVRDDSPEKPLHAVTPNTPVYPGDVITVGESFF